jgi:uncharacterized membrane protein
VLSATILFGTGIGSAYYFLVAARSRDPALIAVVAGAVVTADWLFTATTLILQPLTGWYLLHTLGIPWRSAWVGKSVALFVLAVACWLPVVVLQIRMRDLARAAAAASRPLGHEFTQLFRCWILLGVPALVAFLAIFYLMVAKPP